MGRTISIVCLLAIACMCAWMLFNWRSDSMGDRRDALALSLEEVLESPEDSVTTAQSDAGEEVFRFAAGGFRDFTRIASSDPVMWKDIALANKSALLGAIDLFSEHLAALREDVAGERDGQLLATFSRAKQARDDFAAILAARNNV